ncbi:thioredoxin family protein [Luedemannella helvata]|uniref:Thioredoxin family protein n=1 Tax=Luedemannella helvata TaxID=349315 RepID=A0ABP4WVC9_9ACTN
MQSLSGALVALAVLVAATAVGFAWRKRNGRFTEQAPASAPDEAVVPPALRDALELPPGTPVTLLQFSSAFCAPCRATRVICADVARTVPGVAHVEVDAESHLEAVRALDVRRTPTVLIIDDAGRIRRRASGAPTKAQLLAALAEVKA